MAFHPLGCSKCRGAPKGCGKCRIWRANECIHWRQQASRPVPRRGDGQWRRPAAFCSALRGCCDCRQHAVGSTMELRQILKHTSFQKILPRVELRQILKHTSFQKILPRVLISTDISIYIYMYIYLFANATSGSNREGRCLYRSLLFVPLRLPSLFGWRCCSFPFKQFFLE